MVAALAAVLFYAALIYFAARNWDPLALRTIQFDVRGIIVALLFQFAGYLWNLRIWQMLFAQLGYRLRFLLHLKVYAYSGLAVKIPGFFWGIATRIVLYRCQGVPVLTVGAVSLIEIVFFAIASSILTLLVMMIQPRSEQFIPLPVIAFICIILLVGTHPRFLRFIAEKMHLPAFTKAIAHLSWRKILLTILAYLITLSSGSVSLFAIMCSVAGYDPGLFPIAMYAWTLSVLWSALLSWLPFDFGLRQGPFLIVLSTAFSPPVVVVLMIVWRVWFNACELLWGIIAFGVAVALDRKHRNDQSFVYDTTSTPSLHDAP
ncbi:MAG: hypothetical protein RMJ54_15820 [Roseiflexaceae bacterium]|nr:hypothetical protein [Roseiflexus sp.]MDW8234250.1 hypothetical protein [Roseiflexaceae bacterium]